MRGFVAVSYASPASYTKTFFPGLNAALKILESLFWGTLVITASA